MNVSCTNTKFFEYAVRYFVEVLATNDVVDWKEDGLREDVCFPSI